MNFLVLRDRLKLHVVDQLLFGHMSFGQLHYSWTQTNSGAAQGCCSVSRLPSNRGLNVERNSLCTAPGAVVSITASVCMVSHSGSVPDIPTDRILSPPGPCPRYSRVRYACNTNRWMSAVLQAPASTCRYSYSNCKNIPTFSSKILRFTVGIPPFLVLRFQSLTCF